MSHQLTLFDPDTGQTTKFVSDTTPQAAAAQATAHRQMGGARRIDTMLEMNALVQKLCAAGVEYRKKMRAQ